VDPLLNRVRFLGEHVGNLIERLGGQPVQFPQQAVGRGGFEDGERTPLSRCAQLVQHPGQVRDCREQAGKQRGGVLRGCLLVLAQLFENDGSFDALDVPACWGSLERFEQRVLKLLDQEFGVFELVHELEELAGHLGLLGESFGIVERLEDFVLLRNRRGAQNHGVGLLRREIKMGIFLQQLARVLPPFLPLIGGNNRAREQGFHPVSRGRAMLAEKHETEQRDGVFGGEPLQAIEVGELADFDVVVADGREAVGGVGQLHAMGWVMSERDNNLSECRVEGFHTADAPAFVLAVGSHLERKQGLDPGDRGWERCTILIKLRDGEDGLETGIRLMELTEGLGELDPQLFVSRLRFCLQLKGIEPFVMLAVGLDALGDQGGKFCGHVGLSSIGKFLCEKEQKLGLVRELLC